MKVDQGESLNTLLDHRTTWEVQQLARKPPDTRQFSQGHSLKTIHQSNQSYL
ncbi:MAG TPA: hypothetical protein IGS53_00335 [Leptolyngbyaceae cyanobacterium M33_DOE_097]|nr:hypothetical protein [Leptolyngbyaceae cyanobacterium M33_DOE_097]